tara:strand:+ start:11824 stop:12735 length:912 start_codon:yes stop_codon:yes gene_type:complete
MATWKAVVDKTSAQTLTNKTLTSPKLNENVVLAATSTELNLLDGLTAIDTDISSVSGSDDTLASAKSIKTYVDAQVTAADLDFQGDGGGALNIDLDSEVLDIAGGTNITTAGSSNTLTVNLDASPSVTALSASGSVTATTSLKTPLIEYTDGDNAISIADGGAVTTASDLTVTGNLVVSGTTTTINTATLEVEDKLIKLANVGSPDLDSATGAGVQIEGDATEANWSEIKWTKAKGGGNTDGAGTATGLTGWTVSNFQTSNQADYAVAIMDYKTDAGAPSGNSSGIGSLLLNTNDGELYIRTA